MLRQWPKQSGLKTFYGNPLAKNFEAEKLIRISTPFKIYFGQANVQSMCVNKKCAEAFREWFDIVWVNAGHKQWVINSWGMSSFGGSWNVRPKRAGGSLSTHAYGCAVDFDPARNAYNDLSPNFGRSDLRQAIVDPFISLGGVWGGDWRNPCDGMHFQFARVG